jgi:hypothetical protein
MDRSPPAQIRYPRSPLSLHRGTVARYVAWFSASCPQRARRALTIAEFGIRDFAISGGNARAEVPSSGGGLYTVELDWGGRRPPATPRGFLTSCPCPDGRPWCKHAMALALHVADLR